MTIPKGSVLYKRYVTIGKEGYLRKFLGNAELCQKIGIYYVGGTPLVPIYEVIDGLAFAERRSDHILASYSDRLESLRNTRQEARFLLEDATFRSSTREERRQLELVLATTARKIESIQALVAEHAYRQVKLNFYFEQAKTRLIEMAVLLERIAFHIRTRNIRIGAIQTVLNQILSELPYFNSKEVKNLTRVVIISLKEISDTTDRKAYATYLISDTLRKAANRLFQAANLLQTEALKVDEDEKRKADQIIKFGA